MYEGNPGEIDFGSSKREVRVSEGSSCRESTQWGIRSTPLQLRCTFCLKKAHKGSILCQRLYEKQSALERSDHAWNGMTGSGGGRIPFR